MKVTKSLKSERGEVGDEILRHQGGNDFKLPHIGKHRLQRLGQLPTSLQLSDDAMTGLSLVSGV